MRACVRERVRACRGTVLSRGWYNERDTKSPTRDIGSIRPYVRQLNSLKKMCWCATRRQRACQSDFRKMQVSELKRSNFRPERVAATERKLYVSMNMPICLYVYIFVLYSHYNVNILAQRRHRLDASRAGCSDATRVSGRLLPISPYHRGRFPFHFRLTTLQRLPLVFFTPYEKVLHAASRVR